MKDLAEVAQHSRRRDDDKLVEATRVDMAIEGFRQLAGKPLLGDLMPVRFLHCAAGSPDARAGPSGTICALLARRRIVTFEDLLNDQRDALRVAFVAQEESLPAISDENESVVRNAQSSFCDHFLEHLCSDG